MYLVPPPIGHSVGFEVGGRQGGEADLTAQRADYVDYGCRLLCDYVLGLCDVFTLLLNTRVVCSC